ncbi:MAG: DUF2190 family protein [Candidatus Bathyarchaeota archaeon]|nr:DUF2190 family protein [Candidatus Termiticorpusculum sp.]MCL2868395.1 DUF2190 family protein [Candidatus Termiticorpusculum sp.]
MSENELKLGSAVKLVELVVIQDVIKASTDLAAGQLVCNDGAGLVPAISTLSGTKTVFVNREDRIYLDDEKTTLPPELKHKAAIYAQGVVVCQKDAGSAWVKGSKLKVGTTGKAALATAATDVIIGSVALNAAAADVMGVIRLGQ